MEQVQQLVDPNALSTQLLTTGFLISSLVWVAVQLKNVPVKLWQRVRRKILYTFNIEENTILFTYLDTYLYKHYTRHYRDVEGRLDIKGVDVEEPAQPSRTHHGQRVRAERGDKNNPRLRKVELVISHYSDYFYIWYRWRLLRIAKGREKMENASNTSSPFYISYTIKGLWAKRQINNFVREVIDYYEREHREVEPPNVYLARWGQGWSSNKRLPRRPLDSIILSCKDELVADLDQFLNQRAWYQHRSIPWKRGYLLSGPPGTGKSSLAVALANYAHLDVFWLSLNDITGDNQAGQLFSAITPFSLVLIEDIDAVFNKGVGSREEQAGGAAVSERGISLSSILQGLDGLFSAEGTVVVMTTNYPDRLDPALIRSGRIDRHFVLPYPAAPEVTTYLTRFYEQEVTCPVTYPANLCMADVQEECLREPQYPQRALANLLLRAERKLAEQSVKVTEPAEMNG